MCRERTIILKGQRNPLASQTLLHSALPGLSSTPRQKFALHRCSQLAARKRQKVIKALKEGATGRGVVITGGSKGLGCAPSQAWLSISACCEASTLSSSACAHRFAMAREFLAAGDAVVLCSRSAERVRDACDALRDERPGSKVLDTRHIAHNRACTARSPSSSLLVGHMHAAFRVPCSEESPQASMHACMHACVQTC